MAKTAPAPVLVCRWRGHDDRFFGKYKSDSGQWVHIPGGVFPTEINTSAKAEKFAREWWARQRDTRARTTLTVTEYAHKWFADRERRGLSSIDTDRGRLNKHVLPVIGRKLVAEVAPDDLRAVVERLDDTVRSGALHWNTAKRVWGLVTKMFGDACRSKVAALRVRKDNPAKDVQGPDEGARTAKQWLYPNEVAALLACEEVPLRWRRLYALATYLYPRPGELAALEWKDVHLELGYVHIHQAIDQRTGTVKPTKTGVTRKVPIHGSLAPLLARLRHEAGGEGRVVQSEHENRTSEAAAAHGMPPLEDLAATLRAHLKRAGVERADLHEERATTKRVTFYDLRATGITWEVLAGTDHLKIMQRAGHLNFSTTQGYIREAEALGASVGEPFPPLPPGLGDSRGDGGSEGHSGPTGHHETPEKTPYPQTIRRSNPVGDAEIVAVRRSCP